MPDKWESLDLGGGNLELINLEHPEINQRVIAEMDAGIDVYYDRRWKATEEFGRLLYVRPELVSGKSVLILGAGAGLETVVIGKLCDRLYINDLAPVSLEICQEQLDRNGITCAGSLCGRYEELDLPEVDLIVGCFIIYEKETRQAMESLIEEIDVPILLVNEELPAFQRLMKSISREFERIGIDEGPTVVLLL